MLLWSDADWSRNDTLKQLADPRLVILRGLALDCTEYAGSVPPVRPQARTTVRVLHRRQCCRLDPVRPHARQETKHRRKARVSTDQWQCKRVRFDNRRKRFNAACPACRSPTGLAAKRGSCSIGLCKITRFVCNLEVIASPWAQIALVTSAGRVFVWFLQRHLQCQVRRTAPRRAAMGHCRASSSPLDPSL